MVNKDDRVRLHGNWLVVARGVWVVIALLVIGISLLGFLQGYREDSVLCTGSPQDCLDTSQLAAGNLQGLQAIGLSLQSYAGIDLAIRLFSAVICYSLAGLILWRRPDDWMALLVALWLILLPGLRGAFPAAGRAIPALEGIANFLLVLFWIVLGFFLALFPNGRFVPRWSKFYLLIWTGLFLLPPSIQDKLPDIVRGLAFTSFFLFAFIVQIYRYRRVSTGLERQQTKWMVFGTSLTFGFAVLGSMAYLLFPNFLDSGISNILLNWLLSLILLSLPISIGFAILRYRLWDIDVIIRRTLVWSAMTIFLGGVYFGGVALLQAIFTAVSGQGSPLAIVLSTLAIAALFNPLRKRIQEFVDRRFYRRKYNAEQALASFSALAREEVDLEEITARLLSVVEETMQPDHASLWLIPSVNRRSKDDTSPPLKG